MYCAHAKSRPDLEPAAADADRVLRAGGVCGGSSGPIGGGNAVGSVVGAADVTTRRPLEERHQLLLPRRSIISSRATVGIVFAVSGYRYRARRARKWIAQAPRGIQYDYRVYYCIIIVVLYIPTLNTNLRTLDRVYYTCYCIMCLLFMYR